MNWNITPTIEQPLLFFDFFFGSGLREFYHMFFGYSNADLFREDNTQKPIVTITKEEADAGSTGQTIIFEDELYKLLDQHKKLAFNAVVAFIRTCNDCNRCNHYLDVTATQLINLTEAYNEKELIDNYPLIKIFIANTIQEMYQIGDKYFPTSPMKILENVATFMERYNAKRKFYFNHQYEQLIEPLFLSLIKHGFIHQDTTLTDFEPTLSGKTITKPKVKWIKKGKRNKRLVNKANIFYLFDKLKKVGMIQFDSDTILKKHVQNNFLDDKGEQLKNVQGSFTLYKNQSRVSEHYELINGIIENLQKDTLS